MTSQIEKHKFEAEVQEVLSLVVHSLYANREIFLRELISNASDALDRLRFEALTNPELLEEGETLGIAIELDAEERTMKIADNGIGMSRDELVENLGTIASSGTRKFLDALKEQKAEGSPDLIGQFGVGFYSSFMVADAVSVETRRAGEEQGWCWRSKGDGEYEIEPMSDLPRGTVVRLHMKDDEGAEAKDLLSEYAVRELVKRYSDFVEYPIQMEVERDEPVLDSEGKPFEGKTETVTRTETLNSMKPLWARSKDEITSEEYTEFYHHLTHDWNDPAESIHFKAEGTLEYTALLYLPSKRPMDLFDPSHAKSRVSLYVRRILIMRECEDLLPAWMRFVRGVVESSDLPLNVARESLQDNPRVRQIKKRLVKKVLETLRELLSNEREKYESFWGAFGQILKEGIYYGEDDDQRISGLCLFESSTHDGLSTLAEYVGRMPEEQEAIYTIHGSDRKTVESSPHLEALTARGFEVLFLIDPVDEWMLQRLQEFDGKPLKSVERGEIDLEGDEAESERKKKQEEYKDLLEAMQATLEQDVKEVRFSSRLKSSAAVLVTDEGGLSPNLERMLKGSGQDVPKQKRILELNPDHALLGGLKRLFDVDAKSPRIGEYAEMLLGQALLAEGSALEDPARFTRLVTDLMVDSVQS
ncbi:MAG: molecular chaperone HtpG [Planctomycetota bacterium]|nr:MAG: molecular chaperone HtpG [Planctomycetota bacterium]